MALSYRSGIPGGKFFKKTYVALMLWFVGRAIQAAASFDEDVREEFSALPDGFTFSMNVLPAGPAMIVGKDKQGKIRYRGWDPGRQRIDLSISIKNIENAILLFTFQESTAVATARNRLIVAGEVPWACAVVRVLDMVEVYLLPKVIASLAVKRYPAWPLGRILSGRVKIYVMALLGW